MKFKQLEVTLPSANKVIMPFQEDMGIVTMHFSVEAFNDIIAAATKGGLGVEIVNK